MSLSVHTRHHNPAPQLGFDEPPGGTAEIIDAEFREVRTICSWLFLAHDYIIDLRRPLWRSLVILFLFKIVGTLLFGYSGMPAIWLMHGDPLCVALGVAYGTLHLSFWWTLCLRSPVGVFWIESVMARRFAARASATQHPRVCDRRSEARNISRRLVSRGSTP